MLITSISGIRGTIGGNTGENLTPVDVVSFASSYATWILSQHKNPTIIIGRDARKSGSMILNLVSQTLCGMGVNIINLDLATTPTVEMMVIQHQAQGAIIVTASHNPKEYNGLKMLDEHGEFLSADQGTAILDIAKKQEFDFADVDSLGIEKKYYNHHQDHIQSILNLDIVDVDLIKFKKFKIAVDAINSVGGIAVPMLLEKLGVEIVGLYCEPNGEFQHKPEPLEQNLGELKSLVSKTESDLGIAVDPDVDRLVLVDDRGEMFGEEYTIVSIADYVLSQTPGNTVSNLSSSRALVDVTARYKNAEYTASAVGEKNVVELMKQTGAVIGGEGSGGVIYPPLHYGRDALVGIALFLSHLATSDVSSSELRKTYPNYHMAKEKINLTPDIDVDDILQKMYAKYQNEKTSNIDGVKIDFADSWVHLRKSNTEPIIRIYTEAQTPRDAADLAHRFINEVKRVNEQ
ncbi:MAG: phosphoglucosamine mutase [Minisyncoccia bacterium]